MPKKILTVKDRFSLETFEEFFRKNHTTVARRKLNRNEFVVLHEEPYTTYVGGRVPDKSGTFHAFSLYVSQGGLDVGGHYRLPSQAAVEALMYYWREQRDTKEIESVLSKSRRRGKDWFFEAGSTIFEASTLDWFSRYSLFGKLLERAARDLGNDHDTVADLKLIYARLITQHLEPESEYDDAIEMGNGDE